MSRSAGSSVAGSGSRWRPWRQGAVSACSVRLSYSCGRGPGPGRPVRCSAVAGPSAPSCERAQRHAPRRSATSCGGRSLRTAGAAGRARAALRTAWTVRLMRAGHQVVQQQKEEAFPAPSGPRRRPFPGPAAPWPPGPGRRTAGPSRSRSGHRRRVRRRSRPRPGAGSSSSGHAGDAVPPAPPPTWTRRRVPPRSRSPRFLPGRRRRVSRRAADRRARCPRKRCPARVPPPSSLRPPGRGRCGRRWWSGRCPGRRRRIRGTPGHR